MSNLQLPKILDIPQKLLPFIFNFDKFNYEPAHEDERDAEPQREPAGQGKTMLKVEPAQGHEQDKIAQRLIELGRVAREVLPQAREDHPPVSGGGNADNFRIAEVAQADEHADEEHRNAQHVHELQQAVAVVAVEDHHAHDDPQGAAVARKAPFPDLKNFQRGAEKVIGLVDEAVPEARAYHGAQENIDEQPVEIGGGITPPSEPVLHDEVTEHEAAGEQQSVPADLQRPKLKGDRIDNGGKDHGNRVR